jgi:hypothetical protein
VCDLDLGITTVQDLHYALRFKQSELKSIKAKLAESFSQSELYKQKVDQLNQTLTDIKANESFLIPENKYFKVKDKLESTKE